MVSRPCELVQSQWASVAHYRKRTRRRRPATVGVGLLAVGVALGRRRISVGVAARRRIQITVGVYVTVGVAAVGPTKTEAVRLRLLHPYADGSAVGLARHVERAGRLGRAIRRRQSRRRIRDNLVHFRRRGSTLCAWEVIYADGNAVGVSLTIISNFSCLLLLVSGAF